MVPSSWLLLLYGLPTKQTAERVSLWRKLKKFGALQLKTSAFLLPALIARTRTMRRSTLFPEF